MKVLLLALMTSIIFLTSLSITVLVFKQNRYQYTKTIKHKIYLTKFGSKIFFQDLIPLNLVLQNNLLIHR